MKKELELVAAIDIGSSAIRMKIAEISENDIKIIESLTKSIPLGKDTFAHKMISMETMEDICDTLNNYKKVMKQYNVKIYRIVAASAIREANNRQYILHLIKLKTGFEIDLINNAEKRFLTYKTIPLKIDGFEKLKHKGLVILDIGSASIQITVYKGSMLFSENMKLGCLRINEMLRDLQGRTLDFPQILDDYIGRETSTLQYFPDTRDYNFMVVGDYIKSIVQLCDIKKELNYIPKQNFLNAFGKYIYKSAGQTALEITPSDALISSMILLKKFLKMMNAEKIYTPDITFVDGMIWDCRDLRFNINRTCEYSNDIISTVRFLAHKYNSNDNHINSVEQNCLAIFDCLQYDFELTEQDRLLLQISAILHDIGKSVSLGYHATHSCNMIMTSGIIGISQRDLGIIANVCKYHDILLHKDTYLPDKNFDDIILISKLAAILRMADALDGSHMQRIKDITAVISGGEFIIKGYCNQNILFEEWFLKNMSELFVQVFGLTPVLKIKRVI